MPGFFISFEGATGVGKTTMATRLCDTLKERGHDVLVVPEFSDSLIGRSIHESLTRDPFLRLPPLSETLLVTADRAFFTERVIVPALKQGKVVIKDRYYDSTYVYQPYRFVEDGYHTNKEQVFKWLDAFHEFFVIRPNITFLLQAGPEDALKRQALNKGWRITSEDVRMAEETAKIYEDLVSRDPARFIRIDSYVTTIDAVAEKVLQKTLDVMGKDHHIHAPDLFKEDLSQKTLADFGNGKPQV
ncbi:MAG: dTMP kinase [Candidatus Undinarchaeales archaeon]|jgi:dTMP kinase|nr:dTMP kinase [Candidatus Undinarchaeales archaeon]MDP7493733.1 dTMP kinase [Candidatus Undinarchaeales archaeon]